ncbi:LacI family DNA-binding transcriptional regulator [Microbulbifer thermotolerans]|uniref:LacI family DNA-binding transcriptional regulator n=1 Tax=Microbulbifer thermotolerans TaxID=252514 RepID=A0A143HLY7_MICTH|nr:LacI family DNA-binding transcriptional regulator [Microbulbifer thermotolerans]AMX02703.1 LacI family transcriptional regulator [Microbulbifer thermotolerans]MCX2780357.1 LacI family DNA-binding transcriptional regulator [Microbulbifer thermotolerans]MCX2782520.1 LacI family DNA-binding transcriptional regulator [Microbulbifer thermotolerans]MCX2794532.1 LacI family DNA-binding transcriptional regulator [Microbulbifer thermotolerans]MCX2802190.1 LacI family DNA-binding transcriptional regu
MRKDSSAPVSMSDIARLAGVSESTVSRALNNSPLINEKTRERIQSIARSVNYKVNESARNLRLQRSHTVSVVINTGKTGGQSFSDPFMIDMIGAIADELARYKYDLLFASSVVTSADWHSYLLGARRADGVIVIGQGVDDTPLRELQRLGDPLVVWGGMHRAGADYCIVSSDNKMGGRQATEHLIGLGRRKIVFLGDIAHPEIEARYQGYLAALDGSGLQASAWQVGSAFSIEAGYQSVTDLIKSGPAGFDAIFAASDNIAMGAIKALQDCGYQVPRDVAVVGFDDIPIAPFYTPPLTTVRQNIHRGGELLVDRIMRLVSGKQADSEVLPTELVVRASCGAGPGYQPPTDAL